MGSFELSLGHQVIALGVGHWLKGNHYALQAEQVGSIFGISVSGSINFWKITSPHLFSSIFTSPQTYRKPHTAYPNTILREERKLCRRTKQIPHESKTTRAN